MVEHSGDAFCFCRDFAGQSPFGRVGQGSGLGFRVQFSSSSAASSYSAGVEVLFCWLITICGTRGESGGGLSLFFVHQVPGSFNSVRESALRGINFALRTNTNGKRPRQTTHMWGGSPGQVLSGEVLVCVGTVPFGSTRDGVTNLG